MRMRASFEFLFDGQFLYLVNEMMDQVTIAKTDAPDFEKGALPPGGKQLLDALRTEMDLGPHPDAEIDGRSMIVIEGRRRARDLADPVQRALFYIDKDNGIQRRAEFFTADGTLNTRINYENFKLNLPLSEQRFVYDGPEPPEESEAMEFPEETPAPPVLIP
jgi:outer membrane lipoprotein-sorting protein